MKSISRRKLSVTLLCAVLTASALLTGCANLTDTAALEADSAAKNNYTMQTFYVPESTVPEQNAKVPSYSVTIDVNPSIELKTEGGLVREGKAFNDDGQNILSELSLIGLTVNNAIKVTIAALVEKGYLVDSENEPSLLFTVVTGNEAVINVEALVKDTEETLKGFGIECDVKSAYATDEIAKNAAALGLSAGRYLIMNSLSHKEGITVEEATKKYSAYKINELMKLFEDGTLPKEDDKPEKAKDPWEGLTDDQKKAVKPALLTFKKEVKEADKVFYKAFKEIRKDYKKQLQNLKKEYKKGDADKYAAKLEELKQSMLVEVREELGHLTEKVNAAKTQFTQSVSSLGLSADLVNGLLNRAADREIKTLKKINDFLKAFEPKNGDDEDDDNDQKGKDKNNKENGKNGNKNGKSKGRKSKNG